MKWVGATGLDEMYAIHLPLFGGGSKNRNSKMACPGKWKHGPKPAVCLSCLILSHTHFVKRTPMMPSFLEHTLLAVRRVAWAQKTL